MSLPRKWFCLCHCERVARGNLKLRFVKITQILIINRKVKIIIIRVNLRQI